MLISPSVLHRVPIRYMIQIIAMVACVFLSSVSGFAGTDSVSSGGDLQLFMARLEESSAKIESFQADFVQEKELSLFAQTMTFHGLLVVVRPDKLRWEFTTPVPSLLLLSSDSGVRCSGETKPVKFDLKTDPIMGNVAEQLWLWLGGDYSRLDQTFTIEMAGENSLLIRPKDSTVSEYIEQVIITFDSSNMQPERVVIMEPGGDLTRLMFSNYSFNIKPSEQMFSRCAIQPPHVN